MEETIGRIGSLLALLDDGVALWEVARYSYVMAFDELVYSGHEYLQSHSFMRSPPASATTWVSC